MTVGIDLIHFATSDYELGLDTFAEEKNIDVNKFFDGIGQEKMSIAPPDEDIVTLAAKAADPILAQIDKSKITAILFATETAVDQSKSAGAFLHSLLELPNRCRTVEFKQACYAGTAALQTAVAMAKSNSKENILVIAADIARYEQNSSGEATQGCGAVAMLIKQNPRILTIEEGSGYYTEDVADFWRPNDRTTAIVDGKYSTKVYLQSLKQAWSNFVEDTGKQFKDINHFCYHIPFSRMTEKAHKTLIKKAAVQVDETVFKDQICSGQIYNRVVGNSYCASLFISFCSFLDNEDSKLDGNRFGFFSYGSGSVAEYFSGIIQEGYQNFIMKNSHQQQIKSRQSLSYTEYVDFYYKQSLDGSNLKFSKNNKGAFRLAKIENSIRKYEKK
jgi:hydroxymethylglutaryl-CoA synthase